MSGASAEVMQEYLVKLGFQTDAISLKRFEDGVGKTGKTVVKLGAGVAGVVASVEAAASAFAYSMRKTYFAADLAGTTVKSLQAVTFAGKQFGISSDAMASSVKNMAQALRQNPGLQGLIESFGVKTKDRKTDEILVDLIGALKKSGMPEFQAYKFAEQFGLDQDTFHQIFTNLDEFNEKLAKARKMQERMGEDTAGARKQIEAYTEAMDGLKMRFDIIGQKWFANLTPMFTDSTSALNKFLDVLTEILDKFAEGSIGGYLYNLLHKGEWYEKGSRVDEMLNGKSKKGTGSAPLPSRNVAKAAMTPEEYEESVKKRLGVPKGASVPTPLPPQINPLAAPRRPPAALPSVVTTTPVGADGTQSPRDQFIKAAASRLGVPETAIRAQLTLEAGAKGDKTIGNFNFGNIKAGKSWKGNSRSALVPEYTKSGEEYKTRAAFRSYKDPESAAEDYAALIAKRFPKALGAKNATEYAQGLQAGGYATDPKYVDKITGIASRLGDSGARTVTQNNNTTIHVAGTSAQETARAVGQEQTRVYADLLRQGKGGVM